MEADFAKNWQFFGFILGLTSGKVLTGGIKDDMTWTTGLGKEVVCIK